MNEVHGTVTIPASLASGAHQLGEESQLVVYCIARAMDLRGAGRVLLGDLATACDPVLSRRQLSRVLHSDAGGRYWDLEPRFLRMRSARRVLRSFGCEVLASGYAVRFSTALLDTRCRRGAALLASVLANAGAPRSNAFIARFAGVDRQTISRWMKDPVIRSQILQRHPQWAVAQ